MTDNIRKNKNQHNNAIEHELKFDNKFSLSISTKDPLPVATVSLRGGKKQRETIIACLIFLWGSGDTDRTIKRKHTKHY